MDGCPFPGVGEVLEPYVKPRDVVNDIRNRLHTYLEKHLQLDEGQPLSATNLISPPLSGALDDAPQGLSGVRKAYWNALKAHLEAKAKYDTLKSELGALSGQRAAAVRDDAAESNFVQECYLPLLRQREKLRKLRVVERALSDIESGTGGPATIAVDDLIKTRAGEMPILPSSQASRRSSAGDAERRILELKKAVLVAQRVVNQHHDTTAVAATVDGAAGHGPEAELFALQQARNELITWIETQLAVIGDAQVAGNMQRESRVVDGDHASIPVSTSEIGEIYGQYLVVRRKLLQTLQSPPLPEFRRDVKSQERRNASPSGKNSDKAGVAATSLLPFIPSLVSSKQREQELLQHMAYSRRQLSAAESETERLILRLADESHLVQPGARRGRDWAVAAETASKTTADFVQGRVKTGHVASASAQQTLADIDDLGSALGRLADHLR